MTVIIDERPPPANQWVLEVDWADPPLPGLIGPFASKSAALTWAHAHVRTGEYNAAPLAAPGAVSHG